MGFYYFLSMKKLLCLLTLFLYMGSSGFWVHASMMQDFSVHEDTSPVSHAASNEASHDTSHNTSHTQHQASQENSCETSTNSPQTFCCDTSSTNYYSLSRLTFKTPLKISSNSVSHFVNKPFVVPHSDLLLLLAYHKWHS
jgi:cytoskeletal protein RodZ